MRGVLGRCLIALALVPIGCTAAQKKKSSPPVNTPAVDPNRPFWSSPGSKAASIPGPNTDPVNQPGNNPEISGILAGRVVDAFNRPVVAGSVQIVEMASAAPRPPTDIELEPGNQGRFYLRGLVPGRTYRLIARTKVEGKLLVGEVQARPPEPRLLISVTEEFASGTSPSLPGAPEALNPNGRGSNATNPTNDAPWGGAELGPPRSGDAGVRPDQIAGNPAPSSPRVSIPTPAPPLPDLPTVGREDSRRIEPQSYSAPPPSLNPSPMVPSCLIQAGRLRYLALNDLDGQVWDFSQHRGRVVLLDFWGTWCGPCMRALPDVVRLHSQFGERGLEVIGIACEKVAGADAVRRVRQAQSRVPGMNYRVLMADEYGRCPVQAQFQIASYPTLVLLDDEGAILWRGNDVAEAERVIRRRLGY